MGRHLSPARQVANFFASVLVTWLIRVAVTVAVLANLVALASLSWSLLVLVVGLLLFAGCLAVLTAPQPPRPGTAARPRRPPTEG